MAIDWKWPAARAQYFVAALPTTSMHHYDCYRAGKSKSRMTGFSLLLPSGLPQCMTTKRRSPTAIVYAIDCELV